MWQNNNSRYRWFRGMLAILLVIVTVSGCGGDKKEVGGKQTDGENAGNGDKIVAKYKGGQVTQTEFDSFTGVTLFFYGQYASFKDDPNFQNSILQQLITFKILYDRADDKAKENTTPKVKEQINQFKQLVEAQGGTLEDKLKEQSLTEQDIEQYIERSMVVMTDLEKQVEDKDAKAEYDAAIKADKNAFIDTATVSHILIGVADSSGKALRTKEEALKRAQEVEGKLKNGADFAQLVQEYSDDEGSVANNGTYEKENVNAWVPEFKKAAIELPLNSISDPVETEFGYHIMKVEWRNSNKYDDVKDRLRADLAGQKVSDFIEKELPDLITENNLPKPEPAPAAPAEPTAPTE